MVKGCRAITELEEVRQYFQRINADVRTIRSGVVKDERSDGYWHDRWRVTIMEDGTVKVSPKDEGLGPTKKEAKRIRKAVKKTKVPKHNTSRIAPGIVGEAPGLDNPDKAPQYIFTHRDSGETRIIMVQRRVEKDGQKKYIPFTYWSDGQWRQLEPEGALPLWGTHQLKEHAHVFLHEGASSAYKLLEALKEGERLWPELNGWDRKLGPGAHPWQAELENAAHIGWIGGAGAPERTDWGILRQAKLARVTIVPDNDLTGEDAIGAIARAMNCTTYKLNWGSRFPRAFDLGDPFPGGMFNSEGRYIGRPLHDHMELATFLTEPIPREDGQKGATAYRMRPHAKNDWIIAAETGEFTQRFKPHNRWPRERFNQVARPFSHVDNPARILEREGALQRFGITYQSGAEEEVVDEHGRLFNLWRPPSTKPTKGDVTLFEEYLAQLIAGEADLHQLKRWCATLIARPATKMHWAVFLRSTATGRGKSTLGDAILGPLVGALNYSSIGQLDTNSQFNHWAAEKRLVCIHEIRKGGGWAVERRLKSLVTEPKVTINKKYISEYTLPNTCHILALSNYEDAIRLDPEDRRWHTPKVREEAPAGWGKGGVKWRELYAWLERGGLPAIAWWAAQWGDYVIPGEKAPESDAKHDIIEGSRTPAQEEAVLVAHWLAASPEPKALSVKRLMSVLRQRYPKMDENGADKPMYIRRAMLSVPGVVELGRFTIVGEGKTHVLVNSALGNSPSREGGGNFRDYMVLQDDILSF